MRKHDTVLNILNFIGYILFITGLLMLIPLLYANIFENNNSRVGFFIASFFSLFIGIVFMKFFKRSKITLTQGMLICGLGWIVFSFVAAIPYAIDLNKSFLDSYFEAMSGVTTTGITMFSGLDHMPKSILLWRSMTQWIGGLGILTFFIGITSQGGDANILFGAESHKINSARPVPGIVNTVKILWMIYTLFTVIITVALYFSGLSFFDSINHAMTALSTGGFSTHDASIEYYKIAHFHNFRLIEYIITFGMFLGGVNFLLHYKFLKRKFKEVFSNIEFKYFVGIIFLVSTIVFLERVLKMNIFENIPVFSVKFWKELESNFRIIIFQVISLITTTGFGTKDINLPYFGVMAKELFLALMVLGGSVGSTAGGFKVMRLVILNKSIKKEVISLIRPRHAIKDIFINKQKVEASEISRIAGLFYIWMLLLFVGGLITSLFSNYTAVQSFSGMFSALGNIGPMYIPLSDLPKLHPVIKLTYILGMLAGRLEILPVLLLFSKKAWTK